MGKHPPAVVWLGPSLLIQQLLMELLFLRKHGLAGQSRNTYLECYPIRSSLASAVSRKGEMTHLKLHFRTLF